MKAFPCFLAFAALALCAPAYAQENTREARPWYWYVSAGDFKADETTGQLENEDASLGLMLGAGVRPWRYIAFDAEIAMFTAEYDSPPLSVSPGASIDPRMRVTSAGVSANTKAIYDFAAGSVYAGVGLGVFGAEAEITGHVSGFPVSRIEDDTAIGYQLLAGGDVAVARRSRIGLEYRRYYLEADFGDLSRGKADIGGDYVGVKFRQTFHP